MKMKFTFTGLRLDPVEFNKGLRKAVLRAEREKGHRRGFRRRQKGLPRKSELKKNRETDE